MQKKLTAARWCALFIRINHYSDNRFEYFLKFINSLDSLVKYYLIRKLLKIRISNKIKNIKGI